MELERICQLASSIEDEAGKQAVLDAEETIADTFSQMIRNTAMFMIDGIRPKHDLSATTEALRLLHEQGRAHWLDFGAILYRMPRNSCPYVERTPKSYKDTISSCKW